MEFILIPITALGASLLTFFCGFGLGTILLPVFLLFFSIQEAILLTASVHLLNNLFKGSLIGQFIRFPILLRFGIPSLMGAWLGSEILLGLGSGVAMLTYNIAGRELEIFPINLIMGILMLAFTLVEVIPKLENLQFEPRWMIAGGLVSGFFGGFSGHQGALRSAFLVRSGLSKEAFIATGTAIAIGVDIMRISNYISEPGWVLLQQQSSLILLAIGSAFLGSFIGKRLLKKTSLDTIQKLVALFMVFIALLTILGLLN
jgi:uncharacterized membrane protein YfcA